MNPQVPDRTLQAAWKLLDAEREATKRLTAENAALRAQLEAGQAQEPVAEVVWFDPELRIGQEQAGLIIDCSIAFMDRAKIGDKLYTHAPDSAARIKELEAEVQAALSSEKVAHGLFASRIVECDKQFIRITALECLNADLAKKLRVARDVVERASEWIGDLHGDNCYVSDHYPGDPGNRCNCGLESLQEHINEFLATIGGEA